MSSNNVGDDEVPKEILQALAPPTEEELKKKYEEREYQTYLYQRALEENVIICLPTGCGKTFIAVRAVLHYLVEALEKDKKIVFLATTVPLVRQQGEYLKSHVGNSYSSANDMVGIVTGDMKPEDWSGDKWKQILLKYVVFAMTDQILRQAVERGHITWDRLSLVVLDECHNATKNHPMASLMGFYATEVRAGKLTLPRIIGLSATIIIGNSKIEKIPSEIDDMEKKLCSKAITYHDYEAVLKCATQANICTLEYTPVAEWKLSDIDITIKLSDFLLEICEDLERMESFLVSKPVDIPELQGNGSSEYKLFWSHQSPIKDFVKHITEIQVILKEMGPYCAENAVLYKIAFIKYLAYKEKRKRKNSSHTKSGQQLLLSWLETKLDFVKRQLHHFMFYASPEDADESYYVANFISPKLKQLVEVLKTSRPDHAAGDKEFCGIVFCQKRITAQMLCYYLQDLAKHCPETFGYLKCSFTLGTSGTNNAVVQTLALRMQDEVLDKFRQKGLNILVATKVLEEGLDVPNCNFICRYDPIVSYPSFVQSMGRARQRGAKFYSLVESNSIQTETSKLDDYGTFSTALSEALIKNVEVPERYYSDDTGENDTELNKQVPPFRPTDGPSMITAGSATQIAYRYCEALNTDRLSTLSPYAKWRTNDDGLFQVYVHLPPSACVKYAESGWYSGKTVAKKAAFLEVCKKLYAAGVLHPDTLLPIPRGVPTHISEYIQNFEKVNELPKDGRKIGSKNRVQWYQKKTPDELTKRTNVENLSIYLVKITLEACYAKDDIKSILEFDNHQFFFGIVTAADLEMVPDFLIFSRDGNFRVHLLKVDIYDGNERQFLSDDMLHSVKSFQRLLFCKDQELMSFTHPVFREATDDSYYIAPLKRNAIGNFELAKEIIQHLEGSQAINYTSEISMADRRIKSFIADDFSDALVIPCYSPQYNERQKFCVLSIDTNRTPRSPFDDPTKAPSFAEYYKLKHGIVVMNQDDPLLKAKAISKQLNYLVTKYEAWKMSSTERREAKHCSSVVTLISELMRIHPLPSTLFVQSKMLPSIIHRIQRLLLAREIQSSVNNFLESRHELRLISDNIRHEADLQRLNEEMRQKAALSLDLDPALSVVDGVSAVSIALEGAGDVACPEIKSQSMNLFSLKRKLYWVEIEYIHPKDIQRKDLEDPFDSSDDEDADILSPPSSPSTSERVGIPLIESSEVPCENFDSFNHFPNQPLLLSIMEAMTLANAQDYQDLERYELMGDSVLKLVVTLHIYTHFSDYNEGQLTALRTKLISNKHLYIVGERKKLGDYLAGGLFHPDSSWLPPGVEIPQNLTDVAVKHLVNYNVFYPITHGRDVGFDDPLDLFTMNNDQLNEVVKDRVENYPKEIQEKGQMNTSYTHSRLGDKSIADCLEALIGCYYLSGGLSGALNLMGWVGLRGPTNEQPVSETFYKPISELPRIDCQYPSCEQKFIPSRYVEKLEQALEYRFKNKWLIVEALTHPTFIENGCTNAYQRLEFMGDAVLDFLITHHIYSKKNVKSAGLLTDLRSALVNNVTFGCLAVRYEFHKSLCYFSPNLQASIDTFVRCQEKNNHQVTGAFQYLLEDDCIMAEDIDVPKALGDIFESLAGAVFMDSGMSLDTVWTVFYRLMKNEIDKFSETIPKPAIRQLYERFPSGVKFDVVSPEGETSQFLVQLKIAGRKKFYGCGLTKKSAKTAAAKYAIQYLEDEERKTKMLQN